MISRNINDNINIINDYLVTTSISSTSLLLDINFLIVNINLQTSPNMMCMNYLLI